MMDQETCPSVNSAWTWDPEAKIILGKMQLNNIIKHHFQFEFAFFFFCYVCYKERGQLCQLLLLLTRIWIFALHLCSNYKDSLSKRYSCLLQLLCSCTSRIWNIKSALSACPIKPVFLDFPGEMLQSDKHHCLCSSRCALCHHAISQSSNSKSYLGKEVTAGYCAHWTDTTFPSPPPCQQQLMTAVILKIKQEMISIGDVVADREKWGRSEVLLFFHVSTRALQKGCKGTNVCAAFHVAEGPVLFFFLLLQLRPIVVAVLVAWVQALLVMVWQHFAGVVWSQGAVGTHLPSV